MLDSSVKHVSPAVGNDQARESIHKVVERSVNSTLFLFMLQALLKHIEFVVALCLHLDFLLTFAFAKMCMIEVRVSRNRNTCKKSLDDSLVMSE